MRAFAAGGLAEQDAGALQAGGMELDEFHVFEGDAGAVGHDDAVAGGGEGVGGDAEGSAVAAGAEHDGLGGDCLDLAAEDVVGDEALADAVADDQVERVPLGVDLDAAAEELLEEDGQDGVPGAVGGVAGAGGGVPAEAALGDAALVVAGEGAAHVLEFEDVFGAFAGEHFGRVLVDEEVAALDGVEHVEFPRVFGGVAERGGDAALGCAGVGTERVDLGEDGDVERGVFGDFERGAHAGEAGADDQDIVLQHGEPPNALRDARCAGR